MVDKTKVINFLQDFGCARLNQLQILFGDADNNFKNILSSNIISRKGNVFVHNTKKIDEKVLAALDALCKYQDRYVKFYRGYDPIYITFLTKDNTLYHIIVADKENEKGIVRLLNMNSSLLPKADKYILLFNDSSCYENIECSIPYLYCTYPNMEIINSL